MKNNLPDKLTSLAEDNAIIMIKYHGGSQPGTKRRIQPITCNDTRLRALDILENKEKNFLIAKLEIVDDNDPAPDYKEIAKSQRRPASLFDAFTNEVDGLEAMGWIVKSTDESIELFIADKKTATAALRVNYDVAITIIQPRIIKGT